MSRLFRGRIAAISILTCAFIGLTTRAVFAGEVRDYASTPLTALVAPTSSEDLLKALNVPKGLDVDWMLHDDRQTLPEQLTLMDNAPAGPIALHSGTFGTSRGAMLSHVDVSLTSAGSTTNVNDLLVPVPVLSVGWSIVLSAFLFQIGARVLRLHRRKAV